MKNEEFTKIISIQKLVQTENLSIPNYQRPYKWSIKNVNQLIDDIILHQDKSAYRIGTIVLHQDGGNLNIVDGQQRSITLLLIALALQDNLNEKQKEEIKKYNITIPTSPLIDKLEFKDIVSKKNILDNYREIKRRINDFDYNSIRFFFEKCQVVRVVLVDVSEAFQFFDSQNARGRDLEPHDLLKAFHLRELSENICEEEKIKIVSQWEQLKTDELKLLFAQLLFRVRYWSRGFSARYFTKNDVDAFKGITPDRNASFPYANLHFISHYFIEEYNNSYHRKVDQQDMPFPFQLNQVIINGKRFFEFVEYYWNAKNKMYEYLKQQGQIKHLIGVLDTYKQRNRTGDQYVRNLFDCALLFYWDKFGEHGIFKAAEKLFVWAYSLRLKQTNVQLASVDNYALEYPFVFNKIHQALHPKEVINIPFEAFKDGELKREELRNTIVKLMTDLNYYGN